MKRITSDVPKVDVLWHRDERKMDLPDAKDSPRMQVEDEIYERLYSGELDLLAPDKVDAQMGQWALNFHQQAENSPRYQRLADEVRGDSFASACATEEIAKACAIPDPEPQDKNNPETDENGNPVPPTPMPPMDPSAMRRALNAGVMQATAAVQEARDVQEGLKGCGWGAGTGSANGEGQMDGQKVRDLVKMVRERPALLKIAELAGRFKRIAAHKRRTRVRHGQDELQDIEQGGDIARLIPAELCKLASPKLKLAMLRDVLEAKSLQYRIEGKEPKGKGPIVVCIDKSGSMNGDKDTWATAIALALLQRAQAEKRVFALVLFDHEIKHESIVKANGVLPMDALLVPANGGTDVSKAIGRAMEIIRINPGAMNKADVVLITDGVSDSGEGEHLKAIAKERGATVIGFGIATPKESLLPWCDEVFGVEDLKQIQDGAADALFARE